MRCVVQAALDLSTSNKPFDSVTAAHLLHLLLHQPDLTEALVSCSQEEELQLASPPARASEAVILELNTLAGRSHNPGGVNMQTASCNGVSACSGSVLAAPSAVGGLQSRVVSPAGRRVLSSVRPGSLHHCGPAAPKHTVSLF